MYLYITSNNIIYFGNVYQNLFTVFRSELVCKPLQMQISKYKAFSKGSMAQKEQFCYEVNSNQFSIKVKSLYN
jgi:hypothetical protein